MAVLSDRNLRLVIPALVVAEASSMIGARLGARAEGRFLASLDDEEIRAPEPQDWSMIGRLVEKYGDFPLGATDASIVILANRLRTRLIVTTDYRHFGALRDAQGQPFELLPTP